MRLEGGVRRDDGLGVLVESRRDVLGPRVAAGMDVYVDRVQRRAGVDLPPQLVEVLRRARRRPRAFVVRPVAVEAHDQLEAAVPRLLCYVAVRLDVFP